jgi:hypothetical protein
VGEDILKCIGKLKRIDVSETELNMSVDNELGEPQNFSA